MTSFLKPEWQVRIGRMSKRGLNPVAISARLQIFLREVKIVVDKMAAAEHDTVRPASAEAGTTVSPTADSSLKQLAPGTDVPCRGAFSKDTLAEIERRFSAGESMTVLARNYGFPSTRYLAGLVGNYRQQLSREGVPEIGIEFPDVRFDDDPAAAKSEGRLRINRPAQQTLGGVGRYG